MGESTPKGRPPSPYRPPTISRSPALAYVGVGSNIRPEENVTKALGLLVDTPGITLTGISTFFRTAPLSDPANSSGNAGASFEGQDPDFLNGVLEIRTLLTAPELLDRFARIEESLGRKRPANRYAPRTMDLDLLLYGLGEHPGTSPEWQEVAPEGILAHSDIQRRGFVALPLFELAPDLVLPPYNIPLRALALSFETPGGKGEPALSRGLRSRFLRS
ncbi:MAG: 2-amino-4-hydroxy-6-hydroxymethyldihydropteridine diphosphokinase [Gemmatimonadetes bacterium]|nr:2-amino-4-hydroxy-6-hydroxymethyldihydropteridine diphosphokinase [Gemmatimonadota bacterium]NNM05608.1 2-amino-4-hydroxy-6-hydroxymethyldihydropteridine diphosphokinase [Gemmatimonadota bacterium]